MLHQGIERQSQNDHIVKAIFMSCVESQEAMTTAAYVDQDKREKSQQQPTILMNHIEDCEGTRRQ
jgi:hypothetical protein